MNPGFLQLAQDRQDKIINAGFRIFSQNTYKKAPVAEIASEAGISKALLFYHFKNKKEIYLFLWNTAVELTRKEILDQNVFGTKDFFELMGRSLKAKCNLMKRYPYVSQFSLRAYYEPENEIRQEIQSNFDEISAESERKIFSTIDVKRLRDDIDLHDLYQEMIWAADGYLHFAVLKDMVDADIIEMEFEKLLKMWKKAYEK
ncbi:MAG: TetR/AcrR family transcriptional regulator [Mobilitalea sp.]